MDRTAELKKVRDEVINFTASPLYRFRVASGAKAVIGEGNHRAAIVFVGEAPGKNEAATGRPFCGAAGKVLDELFSSIGMNRKQTSVTNI